MRLQLQSELQVARQSAVSRTIPLTILVFEDSQVAKLAPVTTARAACAVTMGSYRLLDLIQSLDHPTALLLRKHLRQIYALDEPFLGLEKCVLGVDSPRSQPVLALNARLIPSLANLKAIRRLLAPDTPAGVVRAGDQIAAVVRPDWDLGGLAETDSALREALDASLALPSIESDLKMVSLPHEVVAANMQVIGDNLEHRIATDKYKQQTDGVFLAGGATLGEHIVTDTSSGPIVIDEDAKVGPYTLLTGPVYVGRGCRILEHAAIKDEVSLGHTTKVGGEVEAAVIEPYTNKQHHGFLGHSYLGSWINLGAGTCNSDLKNTYGTVNMEYGSSKTATGMQFLGCVMGDYSKSAINTGIFTGKVIGVCSMMYGFVTSNVPSFVNYARLFGQLATLPPEVMIATQKRMFSRRKVEQRECDIQLMHDMYRLTQAERDKFGDEIVF
ncbi:MAG: putative sugar nucleotidyl transferase [Aureliella sp.]